MVDMAPGLVLELLPAAGELVALLWISGEPLVFDPYRWGSTARN